MVAQGIQYADYERLMHKLARKCSTRMKAAGCAVDYDDIFQEIALSWVKARDGFDPSRGYKFSTYFVSAALRNFNRWAEQHFEHRHLSLDADNNPSGKKKHELVSDPDEISPEELAILRERRAALVRNLSPLTRRVLELVEAPPPILLQELRALQERAHYARMRGLQESRVPRSLTLAFVMRAMALGRVQQMEIRRELNAIAGR